MQHAPLPDSKVFDWLGLDTKGVPLYLHPLNLMWSDQGADHDLQIFRQAAENLSNEVGYWSELIRSKSWRHTLTGCTCLLASGNRDFYEDLCFRFSRGGFVSPQVAVALGLLHSPKSVNFFKSLLSEPEIQNHPKEAISAQQVLFRLGIDSQHQFSANSWQEPEKSDATIAANVVNNHWDFWKEKTIQPWHQL